VPLLRIWLQSLHGCACAPDETSIAVAIRRNLPFIERSPSIEINCLQRGTSSIFATGAALTFTVSAALAAIYRGNTAHRDFCRPVGNFRKSHPHKRRR
jgi:hypothetical protein